MANKLKIKPRDERTKLPTGTEYLYVGRGEKIIIAFNAIESTSNRIVIEVWCGENTGKCSLYGKVFYTLEEQTSNIVFYRKSQKSNKVIQLIANTLEFFQDFLFYRLNQHEFSKSYCIQSILEALRNNINAEI